MRRSTRRRLALAEHRIDQLAELIAKLHPELDTDTLDNIPIGSTVALGYRIGMAGALRRNPPILTRPT